MCSFNHRLYDTFMAPIENNRLRMKRTLLLDDVAGDVLEIGFGTGANLAHYPYEQLDSLTLMDLDLPNNVDLKNIPKELPIDIIKGDVTKLPFGDHQFDSVVFTLVFCTVSDPDLGLNEIKRVLKPGGRIYFIEHVEPVKEPYKGMFNKMTPTWKKVAHGCHLNRETIQTIQHAGFGLVEYHRFYRTSFVSGIGEKL